MRGLVSAATLLLRHVFHLLRSCAAGSAALAVYVRDSGTHGRISLGREPRARTVSQSRDDRRGRGSVCPAARSCTRKKCKGNCRSTRSDSRVAAESGGTGALGGRLLCCATGGSI